MIRALITLAFSLAINGTVSADHLMKLSPEKALSAHKLRVDILPQKYSQLVIPKANEPKELAYAVKANTQIDDMIASSDLLTVMKYEDGAIVIDSASTKIEKDDKFLTSCLAIAREAEHKVKQNNCVDIYRFVKLKIQMTNIL